MARSDVARARQSQLVTTYGVGSLLPAADQSFMICGTDRWIEEFAQVVDEPRLARSLGVEGFRTPPAGGRRDVPVVRFPLMHYCPHCRRLGMPREFGATDQSMECGTDDYELVPSRFVACCDNGHIEDFPYRRWVHADQGGGGQGDGHQLFLETHGRSSSLADVVIRCECGVRPVSMSGSFDKGALIGLSRCHGRRPWLLDAEDAPCERPLRTLQRGSSNVWFPIGRSTISIPPWSGTSARLVDKHWDILKNLSSNGARKAIDGLAAERGDISVETVMDLLERRKGMDTRVPPTEAELRSEEYDALKTGNDGSTPSDNFDCNPRDVHDAVADVVAQVCEVSRLREVRALEGFTRVTPPDPGMDPARIGALSETPMRWLPAIEVHGEGVFLRLQEHHLATWEASAFAITRAQRLTRAQTARDQAYQRPDSPEVTARFVGLHTLAHILLKEMSLDAGYPVASLRERVYAGPGQAGILIYTASSDAAGSLGGLAQLAAEDRLAEILRNAVSRASWCSSDPVCAESDGSGVENLNLAACHACVLLPETSCDHRNLLLDRVSVIGTVVDPQHGLLGEYV